MQIYMSCLVYSRPSASRDGSLGIGVVLGPALRMYKLAFGQLGMKEWKRTWKLPSWSYYIGTTFLANQR